MVNRKSIYSILCALSFSLLSNGQSAFVEFGKYGFHIDGKTVIHPIYDYASDFHGDLACVKKDSMWGYINISNQWVSDKYDKVQPILRGYGKVYRDGKFGLVDRMGKEIVSVEYDRIIINNNGDIELLKNGFKGMKSSKVQIPCAYKYVGRSHESFAYGKNEDGTYDIYDEFGLLLENQETYISKRDLHGKTKNEIIAVKDGKYGLFNLENRSWSTPAKYPYLGVILCDVTVSGEQETYKLYTFFKKINEGDVSSILYEGTTNQNDLYIQAVDNKKIKINNVSGFVPVGHWTEPEFEVIFKNGNKQRLSDLIVKKLGFKD